MNQGLRKRVVAVGGGNGTAITLRGLKVHQDKLKLSAVVAMTDSGGANGELSRRFRVLPSADILRAVLALSPYDYKLLHKIFRDNRFSEGDFKGHYLGNLFLMLAVKEENDYVRSVRYLEAAVEACGRVYPATLGMTKLCVELEDGSKVEGEAEIDRPTYERSKKIMRAWLFPEVEAYREAIAQIKSADYVILGPGSLYTSIIPNLLAQGMSAALQNSKAKLIYVVGKGYELEGETGPEDLSGMVSTLRGHLPRDLDAVIYHHDAALSETEKEHYTKKRWAPLKLDPENVQGCKKLIPADIMDERGAGSPEKIGRELVNLME
ncbi:YvcK family protein [Candidatus Uhrbacteria bacterium]|nr:YvcK family protein [Candidatus Uhrbacteria bacterium]